MILGQRFEEALGYAADAHKGQLRKGTKVPYISHVLAVAGLVLEYGGDEDEAIGALLHDVVEDRGGAPRLGEIRARFGDRVATIVDDCSDTDVEPKPPWRKRKEDYIAALPSKGESSLLVSLADKVHNARCIVRDYRTDGEALWERFKGGRAGTLWYYKKLRTTFRARSPRPLWDELDRALQELMSLLPTSAASAALTLKRRAAGTKAARTKKLRAAGRKAARTKKLRAAGKKAARTKRLRAAGRKAAVTRRRRAGAAKAVATRRRKAQ